MNRFEELIKSVSAAPSVIVHLGAGACQQHAYYRTISSGLIIYVEADRTLADAAVEVFSNTVDIKVIPQAIAAENGWQTLNITNNRRFSSLLLPDKLLDFYPNVEVEDTTEVEAITVTKLCDDEAVNKDADNLLVAELQGMEREVFASTAVGTLQRFKWIIIRSGEGNLYKSVSDNTQTSLSEIMQNAGFMVFNFAEDAPPFTNILCVRNDLAIENSQFKALKSNLLDTIEVLEYNLSKKIADLAALKTSTDAETANLRLVLTSRSAELDKMQALIDSATDEQENQQQQPTALTESLKEKEKEISAMRQTLSINNKLILKSHTDLRELQVQYRTALQHQEHQHTLLSELKDKLRQASEFYQELNLQSPVIDSGKIEQDDPDSSDDEKEH